MRYLVVDGVMLSCSYGTCWSKLKVSPLRFSGFADVGPPSLSILNGLVNSFDAAGNLVGQSTYVNGVLQGPSIAFNAAGKVTSQSAYANGVLQGPSVAFNAAGQATQKLMFVGGKAHGEASVYANGALAASVSFKNGLMEGKAKFFNAKGKLALQTNFSKGKEDGMRMSFNVKTGAVLKRELMAKGALVGTLKVGFRGKLKLVKSKAAEAGAQARAGIKAGLSIQVGLPAMGAGLSMNLGADLQIDNLASINKHFVATINDHFPKINILPFCFCTSLANPAVAAATMAAKGVLKPQPCIPMTLSPWIPGYQGATLQNHPVLTDDSQLICAYGGIIRITDPGQNKATIV